MMVHQLFEQEHEHFAADAGHDVERRRGPSLHRIERQGDRERHRDRDPAVCDGRRDEHDAGGRGRRIRADRQDAARIDRGQLAGHDQHDENGEQDGTQGCTPDGAAARHPRGCGGHRYPAACIAKSSL
jgi:hypothetical protein